MLEYKEFGFDTSAFVVRVIGIGFGFHQYKNNMVGVIDDCVIWTNWLHHQQMASWSEFKFRKRLRFYRIAVNHVQP